MNLLRIVFVFLLLFNIGAIVDMRVPPPVIERSVLPQCLSEEELGRTVSLLKQSLNNPEVQDATQRLDRNAKLSPDCRIKVIHALKTEMARPAIPNALGYDPQRYALWTHGSALLVEMHATEALDLLIENLAVTDGLSTSLSHYPSLRAVIEFGDIAIPKLQTVLERDPDLYMRKFAVYCVASIGGSRAKDVLSRRYPAETNDCVKGFIASSLKAFQNTSRPNHISNAHSGSWNSDFYCRG